MAGRSVDLSTDCYQLDSRHACFYSSAVVNSSSFGYEALRCLFTRSAHTPFNLQYYRHVRSRHMRRPRRLAAVYAGGSGGTLRRSKSTVAAIRLADAGRRRRCCQRRHRRVDGRCSAVDTRAASVGGRSVTMSVRPTRCWSDLRPIRRS